MRVSLLDFRSKANQSISELLASPAKLLSGLILAIGANRYQYVPRDPDTPLKMLLKRDGSYEMHRYDPRYSLVLVTLCVLAHLYSIIPSSTSSTHPVTPPSYKDDTAKQGRHHEVRLFHRIQHDSTNQTTSQLPYRRIRTCKSSADTDVRWD